MLKFTQRDWENIAEASGHGKPSDETIGRILQRYQARQVAVDPQEREWLQ